MSKKHKIKTKIVYREHKPEFNKAEVKKELSELEAKRETIKSDIAKEQSGKTGFSKFLGGIASIPRKAAINKAITEKKRILGTAQRTEAIKGQIGFLKQRTELEKAKTELREAQNKSKVNFDDLFVQKGGIKTEDIFK